MKRIEERQFDFIPQSRWTKLSDIDRKNLRIYRSKYRWYKTTDDRIKELENELKSLKERKKGYVKNLTRLNEDLDHLRNNFNFSFSITTNKNRPGYYSCSIENRQKKRTGSLGGVRDIKNHLRQYFKNNPTKLQKVESRDWKEFLRTEVNGNKGENPTKTSLKILDSIFDKSLWKGDHTINRDWLFPLTKKSKSKPKPKGVSIPIMITNQMRMDLLTLGWTRDEMKELTPKECWEIINKGVPKKPSRERGRNQ